MREFFSPSRVKKLVKVKSDFLIKVNKTVEREKESQRQSDDDESAFLTEFMIKRVCDA